MDLLEEMLRFSQLQAEVANEQREQNSGSGCGSVSDSTSNPSRSDFNFVRATEGVMRLEAGAVTTMGTIKAYEEMTAGGEAAADKVGGGNVLVPGLSAVFFRYMQSRFAKVTEGLEW